MSQDFRAPTLFTAHGLTAVITGGGTGLGLAMAHALATNGAATVYVLGRREAALTAAAAPFPDTIVPLVCDVTSKDSLAAAADTVRARSGHLDLLVANSGVLGPKVADMGLPTDRDVTPAEWAAAMWEGASMEAFTETMHVNVTGAFYSVLAFLGLLDEGNRRRGKMQGVVREGMQRSQVVVTSSIAGFSRVPSAGFAYSVSKAGANHLVKILSTRFGEWGVRVNGVAPGMFPSEINRSGTEKKKEGDVDAKVVPARRFGTEEEMAGVLLFLASPAGGYMNGEVMVCDGGRLGQFPATY